MIAELAVYWGLFLNAFVAATLLPAFSEASFAALLVADSWNSLGLYLAVTTGNILGAFVNYWIGLNVYRFRHHRWFPFKEPQIERASASFDRYGKWSLLFAWLPVVGDPLTLVAGVLRTKLITFAALVSVGKAARYGVIWFLALQIT